MDVPLNAQHTELKLTSTTPHNRNSNFITEQASRPVSVSECSIEGAREGLLLLPAFEGSADLTTHPHPRPRPHVHQHPETRLRKKPKSLSTASTTCSQAALHQQAPMRRLSGIPKTLSFPTFHSQPSESTDASEQPRPSSSHSPRPTSPPRQPAPST